MTDKLAPSDRHKFVHDGRVIYEWDQTISEVNIYVDVPPGVRAKQLFVEIKPTHLKFGISPNPPYLDHDLAGTVKVSECFWTIEDGVLHITLTKVTQAEPWPSAVTGHQLDPLAARADTQRLLLERFQAEHPGFDFSGAQISGEAPNPAEFMGGMPRT